VCERERQKGGSEFSEGIFFSWSGGERSRFFSLQNLCYAFPKKFVRASKEKRRKNKKKKEGSCFGGGANCRGDQKRQGCLCSRALGSFSLSIWGFFGLPSFFGLVFRVPPKQAPLRVV
jgi:hypothetical protein